MSTDDIGDEQHRLRPYQFQPGRSGNPLGRTKGSLSVAQRIARLTHDGGDIVQLYVDVMRGQKLVHKGNGKLRLEAAAWLADRLWGKPVQAILSDQQATIRIVVTTTDSAPSRIVDGTIDHTSTVDSSDEIRNIDSDEIR